MVSVASVVLGGETAMYAIDSAFCWEVKWKNSTGYG